MRSTVKWILSALLLGFGSPGQAGHETHGGDMAVALFYQYADKIEACLNSVATIRENPETMKAYIGTLNLVEVFSEDRTFIDGKEVDAINWPDVIAPKIFLNRSRWLVNSIPDTSRVVLVLHEMLSLMGFQDFRYQYSNAWTQQMSGCLNRTRP